MEGFLGSPPAAQAMMQTKSSKTRLRIFRLIVLTSLAVAISILVRPAHVFRNRRSQLLSYPVPLTAGVDLAKEWKDDVWPMRPQAPWDISTDLQR